MAPLERVWILYDSSCGLCTEVRDWIQRQVPMVAIGFIAGGSVEAVRRFPGVPAGDLAVVGNTGEVWLGNSAWIVCLWALRDYRDLAVRLSNPLLIKMAREAFGVVSKNRAAVSQMMGLKSEREIEMQLRKVTRPACVNNPQ